jgi:gliding motility-associated-like protein
MQSNGTYTVNVSTPEGCISDETKNPSDISCLIQKGISPNGDGFNDSFLLSDVKKLQIFNRYGTKVYDKSNYTNQWYGTTNDGKKLPDGTYYYVIERDGQESVTGWIYVIHEN